MGVLIASHPCQKLVLPVCWILAILIGVGSYLFSLIKLYWNIDVLVPLPVVCGCFHATLAEFSSCDRHHMAHKA